MLKRDCVLVISIPWPEEANRQLPAIWRCAICSPLKLQKIKSGGEAADKNILLPAIPLLMRYFGVKERVMGNQTPLDELAVATSLYSARKKR